MKRAFSTSAHHVLATGSVCHTTWQYSHVRNKLSWSGGGDVGERRQDGTGTSLDTSGLCTIMSPKGDSLMAESCWKLRSFFPRPAQIPPVHGGHTNCYATQTNSTRRKQRLIRQRGKANFPKHILQTVFHIVMPFSETPNKVWYTWGDVTYVVAKKFAEGAKQ